MSKVLELLESLEGCKVVKRQDGVIEVIPNAENREMSKFNDGDFVYFSERYCGVLIEYVFIFKSIEGAVIKQYFSISKRSNSDWEVLGVGVFSDEGLNDKYRSATKEEEQGVFDLLSQDRKIWNPKTKTIEEDRLPRIGDQCVFWDGDDDGNSDVVISKLTRKDMGCSYPYSSQTMGDYENCVRLQDFDFEAMRIKTNK